MVRYTPLNVCNRKRKDFKLISHLTQAAIKNNKHKREEERNNEIKTSEVQNEKIVQSFQQH